MSASYDQHLWANGIPNSFPGASRGTTREDIHDMLEEMRKLRNSVMHHEAVFDRSPKVKMTNVMNVLSAVSVDTKQYVASLDDLTFVINQRPIC